MVERKTLRNVLHEVLSSADEEDVPGLEGLSALIHRQLPGGGKEAFSLYEDAAGPDGGSPPAPDTHPESHGDPEANGRRRATHYLSEETLDDLGWARNQLGHMLNDKLGESPSNSEIVDKALKIVLDDFQEKGMDSTLVRKILTIKKKPL